MYCSLTINTLIFGKIKYVKDEIVTSTGFTNATPQRKVLFIDRVTGQSNGFEGVITKVMYNQSINSTSINPWSIGFESMNHRHSTTVLLMRSQNQIIRATLGIKFDGLPGKLHSLYFEFTRVSEYRGQCFELCGLLHQGMPITMQVNEVYGINL